MSVYHVSVSLCVCSHSAFACLCTRISYHVHELHEHMLIVNRDSTSEEAPNDWFHDIRKWQGKYSGWAFVSEPSLTLITPAFSWETISEWLLVTVKTPWERALQIEQNWNKEEHTWLQKQWQEGSMNPFSSFRSVDKITATTRPPNLSTTANNNRGSNSNNNDDKNNSTKTETIHKSTCDQPCQNPLYYCSRPPFQAPWRCQLACWCKLPAWQSHSSQYFQVQKANCIKLRGTAQNYSRTLHFHFDDSILSKAPTVTRRGVLSRRSESQQQPVGHTSAQMGHTTLKTVQRGSNSTTSRVDSNRTCPVYGMASVLLQ